MARTEEVILDFEVDAEDSIESIDSLTAANKRLREERKKVNLQSDEGQKRVKEINAQLDANNQKIKENVSALEKQKINIGNYKSALDNLAPGLGGVAEGLQSGITGFKGLSASAKLFILTGIGAIIAALVAAFQFLKAAISTNNEVLDKFENITNAIGVIMDVLINRVGKLGEAFIAFVSGDFDEAVNLTGQAFSGLADEIGQAVKQGQLYLNLSRDLEDAQRALRIETAKQENEIKRLVVAAKNRNLTFDEQEALLRKALLLEEDLVATREDLARRDLVLTAKQTAQKKALYQSEAETFDQFLTRITTNGKLSDDEVDKIVDKIEALETARGSSLAFQEKVENSLAAVQEKRAAALEKQNKALKEQAETQAFIDAVNRRNANRVSKDPLEAAAKSLNTQLNLQKDFSGKMKVELEKRAKDQEKYHKDRTKEFVTANNREIELEERKYQIFSNLLGTAANLVAEDSAEHKIFASGQALINTYLAATAALASGSEINPIFGIISAAIAVANGLASVAKINGVEFAEGGWTGPGDKYKAVGVVHADEYVVPKRIVNSSFGQQHIAALEAQRTRGYADGGLVTNTNSQQVNSQLALANIFKNMPAMEVSVKEVTKAQKRIQVRESISKR